MTFNDVKIAPSKVGGGDGGHLLSEEDSAGDVDPAMLGLEIFALSGPPRTRTSNDPDHGLEALLDWSEVHADPLYAGHDGHQLRVESGERERKCVLPSPAAGQVTRI